MSLDQAIEQLEAEVTAFNHGTVKQPKDGTTEWFLLRAKSLGLAQLLRMRQLGLGGTPAAAENYHRKFSRALKAPEDVVDKKAAEL